VCGITGIIASDSRRHELALSRMVVSLKHRGPDGDDTYFFDHCALGHTRLSIVDLECGQQPMLSPNKQTAVTFNGEIYGYQELKEDFPTYPFRTHSDTEVLLALYERYGIEMMPRVPGMFAFAIWDETEQQLFAARDRFGEKPFYYAFGRNGEFLFASEIKALLASELFTPIISREAIAGYLQRLCIPRGQSVYSNVYILPPAHSLRYRNGKIEIQRYWEMPLPIGDIDFSDAVNEFRRLFSNATRKQLIADVPIGAFLSGGLDSSSVVATASRHAQDLRTFSFAFDGDDSEEKYAQKVAEAYYTDHTVLKTDIIELSELLSEMQHVYDEPFADSSNIPTYLLCREASQHLKVVLTGDGGDELLGGYEWYRSLFWTDSGASSGTIDRACFRVLQKIARILRFRNA
jgi:asparagine synthase (glutamine-hydrolysing)